MTYVNIFLVCSAEDLHEDSLEITDFISTLNNLYVEHDLYFHLSVCEDEDKAAEEVEKQKQGNQDIQDSQLFVIVFYKKTGQYALDQFNEAYDQFQESGTPAILTFFRTDDSDPTAEVRDFMDRLDQELGHYFKTYSDIDAMKLYLLMQIKSMGLDSGIVFEDGQAYVQNEPILSVEHLPELVKNLDWRKVREDREKIEEEFVEAQTAYLTDTDDEDAYNRFIVAANRRNELKEQINQLEKDILDLTYKSVEDSAKGNMSPRQRGAYRLLEQGKYREADAILDEKEIFADAENAINMKHSADERMNQQLECYVDEILSKIDIKMTLVEEPDRFRDIEELYEKVVKIEEDENLNRVATRRYIRFLNAQNKYQQGIRLARRYLDYISQTGDFKDDILGKESLASLLMQERNNTESLKEAEAIYRGLLETERKLSGIDPSEFLSSSLAYSCYQLALLLSDSYDASDQKEAEALYRESLKLVRDQCKNDQGEMSGNLASCCNCLAQFLSNRSDPESLREAESFFRESLKIDRKLATEYPGKYEGEIACICHNLAHLLQSRSDAQSQEEAEELHRESLNIIRKLVFENPISYEPDLARTCADLALFLSKRNDSQSQEEAEALYREAVEIDSRMAERNVTAFEGEMALRCSNFAAFLSGRNDEGEKDLAEIEELNRRALGIYRKLAAADPARYNVYLALSCHNLASMLVDYGNPDDLEEAEALYYEALDIDRELAAENPEIFGMDLAIICDDLAFCIIFRCCGDLKRLEEAESLYREALNIKRKLAEECPEIYEEDLARSCRNLAIHFELYGGINTETEELFQEEVDIRRRLAKKNPEIYEEDLAKSCHYLANFLKNHNPNKKEETEALLREEVDVRRRLVERDPKIHKAKLATGCYSLAVLLSRRKDIDEWKEGKALLREAIGIQEELTNDDPYNLASSYDALASILDNNYDDPESWAESLEIHRKSLDIYRRLSILIPDEYEIIYARNCCTFAGILVGSCDAENRKEAEDLYRKAHDIYQRLTEESPEFYQQEYAETCCDLGELLACCHDKEKLDEAEGLFRTAIEVRKKLASKDPQKYEADLTASCDALECLLARRTGEEN